MMLILVPMIYVLALEDVTIPPFLAMMVTLVLQIDAAMKAAV
jgi:hypothetical protein